MIDNYILLDPSDDDLVTIEWNGLGTATISSVSYTLPSPLTYSDVGINNLLSPPITNLRVTGAEHARMSTGEIVNRQFAIRGWNS